MFFQVHFLGISLPQLQNHFKDELSSGYPHPFQIDNNNTDKYEKEPCPLPGRVFFCHSGAMKKNGTVTAYAALTLAMLAWGSSFIALKIAFSEYTPMFVIFGRMVLGMIFFIPVLIKGMTRIRKEDVLLIIVMAVFEPCLYFVFEAKALTLTTASQAGMITSTLPLMVGVAAVFFLGEKLTAHMLGGFILAMAGVIWLTISGSGAEEAPNPALGNIMEVIAMICATGYTLALKKLTSRYSPFFLTGIQTLIGSLFFLPLCLFQESGFPAEWSLKGNLAVLYLGIVVTIGGYGLNNFGTSRLPASKSAAFVNLIPVISLLLSILILKEKIGITQLLASTIILAGVIISQIVPVKQKERPLKTEKLSA